MDPKEYAEHLLAPLYPSDPATAATVAVGYALIALCDRLDDLSCIVALPKVDEEEE